MADLVSPIAAPLRHAYAALNGFGIISLLVLILTILVVPSSRLKRDATLLNCFIVIVLVDFLNILYYLVNKGKFEDYHMDGLPPYPELCKVQACLLAGSQAAQAAAVFAMVTRLWIATMKLSYSFFWKLQNKVVLVILLALPYICILAFIPPMALHSISPEALERLSPTPFYCSIYHSEMRSAYSKLAAAFAILSLLIELHLIFLVSRRFKRTVQAGTNSEPSLEPERASIELTFYIRVGIFVTWTIIMIASTLYQAFDVSDTSPFSDMAFACVGPLAFLCFGTQPDILRVWGLPKVRRWIYKRVGETSFSKRNRQRQKPDDGWVEFLGRDDSESGSSTGSRPGGQEDLDIVDTAPGAMGLGTEIPSSEIDVEKAVVPDTRGSGSGSENGSSIFDLFVALNRTDPPRRS